MYVVIAHDGDPYGSDVGNRPGAAHPTDCTYIDNSYSSDRGI